MEKIINFIEDNIDKLFESQKSKFNSPHYLVEKLCHDYDTKLKEKYHRKYLVKMHQLKDKFIEKSIKYETKNYYAERAIEKEVRKLKLF